MTIPPAADTFVLDASVALSWVMPGEASASALDLRRRATATGSALFAPPTFWAEVANVLWVATRRDRLTSDLAQEALRAIADFGVSTHEVAPEACLALAIDQGIAVYDAAYLVCALDLQVPIWTIDVKMAQVARGIGLHVSP